LSSSSKVADSCHWPCGIGWAAVDPKLQAAVFWSTDWSTFDVITRSNGSNSPRIGKLTFADAPVMATS